MMTELLSPSNALCKANAAMMLAGQQVLKAQALAAKATDAAQAARKRAFDDLSSTKTIHYVAAPTRTSTKSFSAKDPAHALAALKAIDLDDGITSHPFSELGITAYKYSVRTASERMTEPITAADAALYTSTRASAMMAAKTVRYIYEVALELAVADPERYSDARRVVEWHTPQQILKGRDTRGAGIVMFSNTAFELVKTALATATERVAKRVEAAITYKSEMDATAAAAAGSTADSAI